MFRKSVNSIVANIAKQIDALHAHAEGSVDLAEKHFDLSDHHKVKAIAHDAEAARAKSIAGRLSSLIQ